MPFFTPAVTDELIIIALKKLNQMVRIEENPRRAGGGFYRNQFITLTTLTHFLTLPEL